jgi:hypothetical protein
MLDNFGISPNQPHTVCVGQGACFNTGPNGPLPPPARDHVCDAKLLAKATLVGLAGGPPDSDPGDEAAHAVKETAKNPFFQAAVYTLVKRAVGRVTAAAADEVVPFVGQLAGAYIVGSSVKDGWDYYSEHAEECE